MSVRTKLTLLLFIIAASVVAGSGIFSTISLDNYFRSRLVDELTTQATQAEFVVNNLTVPDSTQYVHLQQYAKSANLRLTLIDKHVTVLFESELPQANLVNIENHAQRPEVRDALQHGIGTSTRLSSTVNIEMLYLAKRVTSPIDQTNKFVGTEVVRVGVPLTHVHEIMNDIRSKVIFVSAFVLLIIVGATVFVSKRIAQPIQDMAEIAEHIRAGDFERRIPITTNDEFGKLALSLNSMVDKLNEDIVKLKKLERMRSEFLGNVSHELRTPIFAVQGMLETLLGGALDDKEVNRDFVNRALINTERLNVLLGDLIEISRIESGEMRMSFRYFNVREFLEHVISEMQLTAGQNNILLTLEGNTLPLQAYGDRDRLKQVMINLIQNAIKYNRPHGKVTVSYQQLNGSVRISIADTGMGIAIEHRSRIFERFYRADKERSREAGGTGLGLAIVKHIVEAHSSSVDVQSVIGEGSTFSFTLKS